MFLKKEYQNKKEATAKLYSKEQDEYKLEEIILNQFDPDKVNKKPTSEKELYLYYAENSDIMIQYLRITVNNELRPLVNEIRALFGHLTEYNTEQQSDKRELEKAYGHFRRLTLDAFKILCDEFDEALVKIMMKQYHYNFNSVNVKYLKDFSDLYISAKQAYVKAQQAEKPGSDSTSSDNIIKLYHEACKEYIKLKRLYFKNRTKVNRVRRKTLTLAIATVVSFVFSTAVSILDFILQ